MTGPACVARQVATGRSAPSQHRFGPARSFAWRGPTPHPKLESRSHRPRAWFVWVWGWVPHPLTRGGSMWSRSYDTAKSLYKHTHRIPDYSKAWWTSESNFFGWCDGMWDPPPHPNWNRGLTGLALGCVWVWGWGPHTMVTPSTWRRVCARAWAGVGGCGGPTPTPKFGMRPRRPGVRCVCVQAYVNLLKQSVCCASVHFAHQWICQNDLSQIP